MNYPYVEVRFWKPGHQKLASLKSLFSFMSYLNVLKYCFYYKPYDKSEIITSSITNSVDLNQSKYKSNNTLKSKAVARAVETLNFLWKILTSGWKYKNV